MEWSWDNSSAFRQQTALFVTRSSSADLTRLPVPAPRLLLRFSPCLLSHSFSSCFQLPHGSFCGLFSWCMYSYLLLHHFGLWILCEYLPVTLPCVGEMVRLVHAWERATHPSASPANRMASSQPSAFGSGARPRTNQLGPGTQITLYKLRKFCVKPNGKGL